LGEHKSVVIGAPTSMSAIEHGIASNERKGVTTGARCFERQQ
jgi:hypothetical protein